ncbi:hypothetical protein WMY93_021634 [Mugilogobius chulae]|uniref:Uncharacterized protein n=1 Tax=Mugilogobius chulae TaxID=88201 RepID=A0AAW0NFW2_9GOBI
MVYLSSQRELRLLMPSTQSLNERSKAETSCWKRQPNTLRLEKRDRGESCQCQSLFKITALFSSAASDRGVAPYFILSVSSLAAPPVMYFMSYVCVSVSEPCVSLHKCAQVMEGSSDVLQKVLHHLATVNHMRDLDRLRAAANGHTEVWIGLHQTSSNVTDRKWHWSQPEVKYNETEWKLGNQRTKDNRLIKAKSVKTVL